jgi:hypothetical protein
MPKRSEEDVDAGLKALVFHAGSYKRAFEETGIPIPTLQDWRTKTYRDRYEVMRTAYESSRDQELGEDLLATARKALGTLDKMLTRVDECFEIGTKESREEARQTAKAAKELSNVVGLTNQHSRITREKPMEVTQHNVTVEQIERAQRAILEAGAIDVDSVEIGPGTTKAAP